MEKNNEEKRSIYDVVWIIYDDKTNKYMVINMMNKDNWSLIWYGESKETAVAVKTAYTNGYYDGQHKGE